MYVKYYGHACFCICDSAKKIVIDPFGDIGYKQEHIQADFCLCTHSHYDHHSTNAVSVKVIVDDNNRISEDWLSTIDSYHDEVSGAKRGKNTIYKILCDGITVCHMGDIGMPINPELISRIGKVELLMLPIGGNYTINAEQAREYALAIKPKIIIPMHYKTANSDIDIDTKEQFLSYFSNVKKCPREFEICEKHLASSMLVLDLDDSSF